VDDSLGLLTTAYRDLSGVLGALSPEEAWEPTGCAGWSVVDLGFHLLSDARRCLVALNTPADGPADLIGTQGRVLTVADFLSTLTVEAAVHHLDFVVRLDRPGPAAGPLAEVRRVLEGLLGGRLPARWDDATAARRGTGREPLTAEDRAELGASAAAFALFG
jgi:hypothetical protein